MTLADPFWLVLIIPLAMTLWLWPLPSRLLLCLRCATGILLLLALCGLSLLLPVRSGTVVLVADRSLSMPPGSEALQKEAADIVQAAMQPGDRLGVVSFAETAAVEQSPQTGQFQGFAAEVGRDASQLADAVDLALSLVPRESPGRIIVLSDGHSTGRDVAASAARATAAGVPVDYRALERLSAGDLAVQRIQGPESAAPGESFMITAWLHSPREQTVSYQLHRAEQVIAQGSQAVPAGISRLVFRDTAAREGTREYILHVQAESEDPVPENNRARLLVGVRGSRPVLCVNSGGTSGLADLLAAGGLDVRPLPAQRCTWTLEELAGHSAVVLENTRADLLGHTGMENLAAWIAQSGGGLMVTGGKDAYGPGGYHKSPLEPIMPISMELRREHRKLSLAIVVALDRSGSMAMPASGGRTKMDLANLATAEVVDMLGPMDQFGCIAVDTIPHEIVPLSDVAQRDAIRGKVLKIDSMGGGIFVYEALAAAARMVLPATAGTKHIILFADAADSEEPGDYRGLIEKLGKAGVTVSVVGLGSDRDCDAPLLKDIARRGGGQSAFTNNAQELPRLFAQDVFLVARSAFIEEPVGVRPTGGLLSITRQPLGGLPGIGGYNLCYTRPGANLAVVSEDEYKAPVLSAWQAGLGRVLCYAGEADGQYTGPIAGWEHAGDFFTSLARWTAGSAQGFDAGVVATQELRDGVCRIELHLDPDRDATPFRQLPELKVLSARPGEAARSRQAQMTWASADSLLAEIPLSGSETVLATLSAPGMGQATLAPMCLPYSPEYLPRQAGRGADSLGRLAAATGGRARVELSEVWADIPRAPQWVSLAPYLLLTAVCLLLLEVAQRRTALLSMLGRVLPFRRRRPVDRTGEEGQPAVALPSRKLKRRTGPPARPAPGPEPSPAASPASTTPASTTPSKSPATPPADDAIADAFAQARQRAHRRTHRG
ncbi:MAG: VWA domain-containing protein [Patescibacteria group bacterium]|nr:VWA domain-containing protein [Patescibacteria group bacterium]